MDRAEILTAMSELKLYGMKAAFDGKRSVGALLSLKARMCSQIRRNGFELTLWMTLMLTRKMAFGGLRF